MIQTALNLAEGKAVDQGKILYPVQIWWNDRQGYGLPKSLYDMDCDLIEQVQTIGYEVDALLVDKKPAA